MNLVLDVWNNEDYNNFISYLKGISDKEYKLFNEKIISSRYEILGIKLPVLRDIAKKILKGDYTSFLECCKNDYFEEVMIKGFVTSDIKDEYRFKEYFYRYIKLIDNWSLCDSFCNSLKRVRDKKEYFKLFKDLTNENEEFIVRVGLIGILNHFVNDEYLDEIFDILDSIKVRKYYIDMGKAWLLCECFIKYRDRTLEYMKESKLDNWSFNKGISKCFDSYRVSKEDKEILRDLKRKD